MNPTVTFEELVSRATVALQRLPAELEHSEAPEVFEVLSGQGRDPLPVLVAAAIALPAVTDDVERQAIVWLGQIAMNYLAAAD